MNRRCFWFGLALAYTAAACGGEVLDGEALPEESGAESGGDAVDRAAMPAFVPMEAIVKLRARAGSPATAAAALPGGVSFATAHTAAAPEAALVRFEADAAAKADPIAATWAKIDELRARADVEYAHPNWVFELSRVPNDPQYANQWHYPLVQLPAAWDLTTGSPAIRIAILDTGRTAHPDLAAKWTPGLEYDAFAEDGDAATEAGIAWRHGVHVASIAAGGSNNSSGSSGVCWNCQLLNVKVAQNDGRPNTDAAARGIRWAVAQGVHVINMSFEANGLPCSDANWTLLRDAIAFAISRSVSVVAAAGNIGANAATTVPASCPGVIAVAATDRNNALAQYSNRGAVTLAAPGGAASLVSGPNGLQIGPEAYGQGINCPADGPSGFGTSISGAVANWTTSNNGHCDRYLSGTSMAAPHVAGVIGLMLSRNPSLSPAQVQTILTQTAQSLPGCAGQCGAGLLNALGAVQQSAALPGGDTPPTASFSVSCSGLDCTFNGGSSTDDRGITAYQWTFPGQQLRGGATATFYMPGYTSQLVRLRVTDTGGQSTETSQYVTPSQPFIAPTMGAYYNPQRSGHGIDLYETSAGDLTMSWCTYEPGGTPTWYMTGTGPRSGARWSQPLYRVTWNGSATSVVQVGTAGLDFSYGNTAWFSWTLNGVPGGERFVYLTGGQGRSGSWYVPTQSGWGIQVEEVPGSLVATVSFYQNGQPRWMMGSVAPGSDVTIPLSYYRGPGLCPSCGGSQGPTVDPDWNLSSMRLAVADGSATTGSASTDIKVFSTGIFPIWVRPLQTIQILTKP